MMLALLVVIERRNLVRAGGLQHRSWSIVTYLAFVHVLQSPLPPGVLGYW